MKFRKLRKIAFRVMRLGAMVGCLGLLLSPATLVRAASSKNLDLSRSAKDSHTNNLLSYKQKSNFLVPEGERGRWGDGEMGRGGDGEMGRKSYLQII
ncbi:MAG: hypothetical protein F6K16_01470 [Symploca sp. SIO2B6]|nr:hypothetical protein [Symploca sp. SIO2B6]